MQAVPNEILQQAYKRKPLYLLKLPFFWGLVFLTGYGACWAATHTSYGIPVGILAGIIIGSFVRGLGSIGHDAAHGTVAKSPVVQYLIGLFAWTATMMSYTLYRTYHLDHHRIVNMPHDVDRVTVSRWTKNPQLARALRVLTYLGFYPMYWAISVQRYARKMSLKNKIMMNLELLFVGAIFVSLYFIMPKVAFWTVVPTQAIVGAFFASLTSMTEHFGIEYEADHAYSSRTYATQSWLADWLWSGTTFHNEHHKYPGIPWYNLKSFHFAAMPYYSDAVKKNVHPHFWPLAWKLLGRAATLSIDEERAMSERDSERLRESVPDLRPAQAA